ncbi:hypothetical protein EZS27_014514 [termite gut metagenome]|uniref:GmrSD restriction endonucleases N-terminal domain-containing protein n=1 Tax=termite gut metagenome TaxID=433724 RepID=A0A5J4RTS4_9ZZZZ
MAKQTPSSPSNKKISELYSRIKNNTLSLQPEFQRKLVWTNRHKEAFIDTILRGLPFPEIYTAQSNVNIEKIETQEFVVDGQQRLSTIVQYIDEPEDSIIFGKEVKKYKNLEADAQKDFLNYNVVIRDLQDIPIDLIKEIFSRINQTQFSLQPVEIQNAFYDGEFITTAKEILQSIEQEHIPIFSDSEMSRMSDLHFILLVMSTLENGGYFNRDTEIEKMIQTYDNSYPNKESIKNKIISILCGIKSMELEMDSIWYRKSNFFTLVIELYKIEIPERLNYMEIKLTLQEFEKNVLANKSTPRKENDFAEYYGYMYTGTNSRQARVVRSEIFRRRVPISRF